MALDERDLRISIPDATAEIHFEKYLGNSKGNMKNIDLIFASEECWTFVEIKDPDCPGATPERVKEFSEKLKTDVLVKELATKFRESVFFRWRENAINKTIQYLVLLSMKSVDSALLLRKNELLERTIPLKHEKWHEDKSGPFFSCAILNVEQWKRKFGADSVIRISDTHSTP